MKNQRAIILLSLLAIFFAAGLRWAPTTSDYIDRLANLCFDVYQRVSPRPYEDAPVRIVDIDDESLAELGQWPWPRSMIATLIERLAGAGAASIAFDITFAEPDRSSPRAMIEALRREAPDLDLPPDLAQRVPDGDETLAATIAKYPVVLGDILKDGAPPPPDYKVKAGFAMAGDNPLISVKKFDGVVANLPALEAGASGNGYLNHDPEWDRVLRRVPVVFNYRGQPMPSLAAEALRVATGVRNFILKGSGANLEENYGRNTGMVAMGIQTTALPNSIFPTDFRGRVWLHYTEAVPGRYISAKDIIKGTFDPSLVEGNIVFVGSSYAGGQDFVATPLDPIMKGVEAHAQLAEQMLLGKFLSRPDWTVHAESLFILIIGIALTLALPRTGAWLSAVFGLLALVLAVGASWYAFSAYQLLIDPVYPSLVILIVYGTATLTGYLRTEAQQRQVRTAFSRYMSPHLVEELARSHDKLKLGGEMRQMTLMFCDIRGFTSISEGLDAHQLTQFINSFLSPMTEVILENKGTIDKYMGDCIMAFWNAPLDDPRHAENAVRAAQGMRRKLLEVNAERQKAAEAEGKPYKPIKVGIGINSGECCVGNMGSNIRFDYSVLGDTVNVASRLEGQSKSYGVDFVIGQQTAELSPNWPYIELDIVAVKGKTQGVHIYTLPIDAEPSPQPVKSPALESHMKLLEAYRGQDWKTALGLLDGGLATELAVCYGVYRERIEDFLKNPPPPDWDGVYVATEK